MKRQLFIIGGVFILIVVLAGGVFTAVRLLASQGKETADYGPGVKVFEDVFDDGSGPVTITTIIEPSPELPDREAEASGVLTRRVDNSLFIGTGSISVNVQNINGEEKVTTDHSGPEIEVVVSHDTLIYRDETELDMTATESVERRLQQVVKRADDLDALPQASSLEVWGERRGDRIIAELLVYGEIE